MKTIIITLLLALSSACFSQGIVKPTQGKTAIYFTRVSGYAASSRFFIMHNEEFISDIKGRGYFVYECDPGHQVFWSSCENTCFLEADLKPNCVYIINARPIMGIGSVRAFINPIDEKNEVFESSLKMINGSAPHQLDPAKFEKFSKKLTKKGYISSKFESYSKNLKGKPDKVRILTEDMSIPTTYYK